MWSALSVTQLKEVETMIIRELLFNPSCVAMASTKSHKKTFQEALQDLGGAGTMRLPLVTACSPNGQSTSKCPRHFGMVVGPYAQVTYELGYAAGEGHLCLSKIFAKNITNGTLHKALRSQACQDYALNYALLRGMAEDNYTPFDMLSCVAFPTCSYLKHVCNSLAECAPCLIALERGDGAGAAHLCPFNVSREKDKNQVYNASSVYDVLDYLVKACSAGTPVACDYWQARCDDNNACVSCSSAMGNGDNIQSFMADSCTDVRRLHGTNSTMASRYIQNIGQSCPGVSACRRTFSLCVSQYPSNEQPCKCSSCITNSTGSHLPEYCSELLPMFPFDVVCRPCPESV